MKKRRKRQSEDAAPVKKRAKPAINMDEFDPVDFLNKAMQPRPAFGDLLFMLSFNKYHWQHDFEIQLVEDENGEEYVTFVYR